MTPVAQDALPHDAETLRSMLLKVAQERDEALRSAEAFRGELATTKAELAIALHKLRLQARALFGPRTEKLTDDELPLFMKSAEEAKARAAEEDAPKDDEIVVPAHTRKRRSGGDRKPLPDNLPREIIDHPLDESQRTCSCCGEERIVVSWSQREVLEHVPAQLKVIVHRRPVAVCGTCRSTVTPPSVGSTLPIPKSIAGPGLLASVVVGKYCDHLPLYRLEGILPRHGVWITRQTMCGWMGPLTELVLPLTGLIRREVLLSDIIQTDDTPVTTLGVREGGATGRFWCYLGDSSHRFAIFDFSTDRKGQRPQKWLKEFKGKLQSDAYAGYDALHRENGGLAVAVACLAHARRNFHESRDLSPEFCGKVLASMQRLYAVESEAKQNKLDHAQRLALRRERSVAEHDALFALLEANRERHLPKSPVRQAVEYMLTRRRAFTEYLEDGALEIDNNACERAIKPVAIGRKNWLFCASEGGGERAAAFFTLLVSARLHEVEPWAWLRDVLDRMARLRAAGDDSDDALRPLLPGNWLAEHPDKRVPYGR